jgi:hypothetical protein
MNRILLLAGLTIILAATAACSSTATTGGFGGGGPCAPLTQCSHDPNDVATYCADLSAEAANCGGCGVKCATGKSCQMGVCQTPDAG